LWSMVKGLHESGSQRVSIMGGDAESRDICSYGGGNSR
jgi:hypothetical protein